jgi:hypothetical protein
VSAVISTCHLFRYRLEREVQARGVVAALFGVNPSTADATINDQTIKKEIGFAQRNDWRRILKGNVFGFRSTDVSALADVRDPFGPDNDQHLDQIIADADILVPCWGSRAKLPRRLHPAVDALKVRLFAAGKPILVFGLCESGDPMHPQMLAYATKLVPWEPTYA